jgi:hypothetical protein
VNENKRIEVSTADVFLSYYNRQEGTSYRVVEYGDAPDVRTCDEQGEILQFDIVRTEDHPGDIKAALARSKSRSFKALRQHVEEVRTGKSDPRDRASKLFGNVTDPMDNVTVSMNNVIDSLKKRLHDKLLMRYGANTALVIRDTSGVDWDWDLVQSFQEILDSVLKELKEELNKEELDNPYDRGIWLVSRSKDRVFHLI